MAIYAGKNAEIFQDGYDITGYSNKVAYSGKRDYVDVTPFNASGHEHSPIIFADEFTIDSFFNDAATGPHTVANAARTATSAGVLAILPTGDAYGSIALFGQYWQEDYPITSDIGDVVKMTQSFKFHDKPSMGKHSIQEGIVLYPKTAVTSDGNGTTQTNANLYGTHTGANDAAILTDASSTWRVNELVGGTVYNTTDGSSGTITANTGTTVTATLSGGTDDDWDTGDVYYISTLGYTAALHIFEVSASDTIDVSVRHSNDNFVGDDTELFAFTQFSALGAEYKSGLTTLVKPYIRAVLDVTGTDVSITTAVQFNRVGG
ncbi:MAG: hypothetical protein SVY53_12150 [Chloroflexota bacterium]|nr:hypothetical protein [Chloroflexota bacterium]